LQKSPEFGKGFLELELFDNRKETPYSSERSLTCFVSDREGEWTASCPEKKMPDPVICPESGVSPERWEAAVGRTVLVGF